LLRLEEWVDIVSMHKAGVSISQIAIELERSPSTISLELRRNRRADGGYRAFTAGEHARGRRSRSRRNARFVADDWVLVEHLIGLDWSPEQVSGWLKLHGILSISHESIYLRIFADKRAGGGLWTHLRQAMKKRRKRYLSRDSRGRLAGKRHISERPAELEERQAVGHWEIDTVKGDDQATPHHSWERGTNENTNGLIRQYLPKRTSMAHVTQEHCDAIAARLNSRSRKRLGYRTPEECYART